MKSLTGVRVVVTWTEGPGSDRDAIQTDVELRLRQAGMRVLTASEQMQTPGQPMLFIGAAGSGAAIPVGVELHERVWLERNNNNSAQSYAATDAVTWQKHGAAQTVQSVQDAYQRIMDPYKTAGVMNQVMMRLVELQMQAATTDSQHFNFGTVRDFVKDRVNEFLNAWLAANTRASGPAPSAQEPQLTGSTDHTNDRPRKSLSDFQPGTSRDVVLRELASDYMLVKEPDMKEVPGTEVWEVVSRAPPLQSGQIWFFRGKTFSVTSHLLRSESPDVVKFVDALQSVLYDSANPPSDADAAAEARSMANNSPDPVSSENIAAGEKVTRAIWKMNNQRFGEARIGASLYHGPDGDDRTLAIGIGGRSFQVRLMTVGAGRTMIDLSEIKR